MLNDWSDRPSPQKRRPFVASGEFWLGVATTMISLTLGIGLYGWLAS